MFNFIGNYGFRILGWSSLIAPIAAIFLHSDKISLPDEDDIANAGYKPELSASLTCRNDQGQIIFDGMPETVIPLNIDPVSVRAIYPKHFDGVKDVYDQPQSIITRASGCIFQRKYTSSDISELRKKAPMLVTIFEESDPIKARYTNIDYNRSTETFSAELRDDSGLLLETIETWGYPANGEYVKPTLQHQP